MESFVASQGTKLFSILRGRDGRLRTRGFRLWQIDPDIIGRAAAAIANVNVKPGIVTTPRVNPCRGSRSVPSTGCIHLCNEPG